HHGILFDHHGYISHSRVFVNRNNFNRARASGGFHGGAGFRGGSPAGRRGFGGGSVPQHSFVAPPSPAPSHSVAFSGFYHGGVTRGFSSRGQSSFGRFHGGGSFLRGGGGQWRG